MAIWSYHGYAVVYDAGNFYYFSGEGIHNIILRLNADSWTWSRAGALTKTRRGHAVVKVDNTYMVIGGEGHGVAGHPEACLLNDDKFTCEEKSSKYAQQMKEYKWYPSVFLVSDDYGC